MVTHRSGMYANTAAARLTACDRTGQRGGTAHLFPAARLGVLVGNLHASTRTAVNPVGLCWTLRPLLFGLMPGTRCGLASDKRFLV